MIKIELQGTTTIVSDLDDNDGSEVLQKHAINNPLDYNSGEGLGVLFPQNEQLTKMAIKFDNITSQTEALLGGTPVDQNDLISKIASANLFVGK